MIEVGVGDRVSIGEAEVVRDPDRVYVKDRYQKSSYIVSKESEVVLKPIPPLNVPLRITEYLLLQFEEPILINKNMNFWVRAPYELAVLADDAVLTYLTPFKVKHTLFGEIIGGRICRYFMTSTYFRRPSKGLEALVKISIRAHSTMLIDNIVIPLNNVRIYVSKDKVYYNIVHITINRGAKVELLPEAPVPDTTAIDVNLSNAGKFYRYSDISTLLWGW